MNSPSTDSNQPITWPVVMEGVLAPAGGKIDQYEFQIPKVSYVNAKLPLIQTNPYIETASKIKGRREKGIVITCKFGNYAVTGQFHRSSKVGIWLSSNRRNGGQVATGKWHAFILHFGITVGSYNKPVPVYLDFYPNLTVVIRGRPF